MKHLKTYQTFESSVELEHIVDEGQFFYDLEDDGFIVKSHTNSKGQKSGMQSYIKIFKPKERGSSNPHFSDLEPFDFDEIKDSVIRFLEMTDVEVEYIYADKKVLRQIDTDMLYDPKGVTRFKIDGRNKITEENYKVGKILQLNIIYGFI